MLGSEGCSHLWVPGPTGDGEWMLMCLLRALPCAAELNGSCLAFWRGNQPSQEGSGHLQGHHVPGGGHPKPRDHARWSHPKEKCDIEVSTSKKGLCHSQGTLWTHSMTMKRYWWVIHISFSKSPLVVCCARWETFRATRNALSPFHSSRPLGRSSVALLPVQLDLTSTASVKSSHSPRAKLSGRASLPTCGPVRRTGMGPEAPGQITVQSPCCFCVPPGLGCGWRRTEENHLLVPSSLLKGFNKGVRLAPVSGPSLGEELNREASSLRCCPSVPMPSTCP